MGKKTLMFGLTPLEFEEVELRRLLKNVTCHSEKKNIESKLIKIAKNEKVLSSSVSSNQSLLQHDDDDNSPII
jgi:hypothetical protein